jgi:hypothetical protein
LVEALEAGGVAGVPAPCLVCGGGLQPLQAAVIQVDLRALQQQLPRAGAGVVGRLGVGGLASDGVLEPACVSCVEGRYLLAAR